MVGLRALTNSAHKIHACNVPAMELLPGQGWSSER